MRAWLAWQLTVVTGAIALAGCGAGASHRVSESRPSSSATASSSATTQSVSPSRRPPSTAPGRLLSDAADALHHARGFAINGAITQGREQLRLRASMSSAQTVDLAVGIGRASEEFILLPGTSYVRANAFYWRSQSGTRSRATVLADRWIEIPAARVKAADASLGALSPPTLARCLVEDHGHLTVAKGAPVAGRPTLTINDAGDAPGAAPGQLVIAATGPPYPLRITATGRTRPGGHVDICNDGKGGDVLGSISFSQFGRVAPIHAPPDPLRIAGPPVI